MKEKIGTALKIACKIPVYFMRSCLFLAGGIFPRRSNVWLFGSSSDTFADNTKYLFTYVIKNAPDVRAIWISGRKDVVTSVRNAGGEAYLRTELRGIYHTLRSKNWFVCTGGQDINLYLSRKADIFNLWHGIPLKKIAYDVDARFLTLEYRLNRLFNAKLSIGQPRWILSTSDYVTDFSFKSAFKVTESQCLTLGYPRNEPFYWNDQQFQSWLSHWGTPSLQQLVSKMANFRQTYLYMPTWRDADPNFISKARWNFDRLNKRLVDTQSLMIFKLHINTPNYVIEEIKEQSNIIVMNAKDDVYPVLRQASVLITDYSSVYLDFLNADREIIFFAFDLKDYLAKSRDLYHDFYEFTPGKKIFRFEELLMAIGNPDHESFRSERKELRDRLFRYPDANASSRIVSFLRSQANNRLA